MKQSVQITFRDMQREPGIEELVLRKVTWLERSCHRITGCRVLVEAPHRHHRNGRPCHVRIDVTIPGSELAVGRDAVRNGSRQSVHVAIHDAFDAARRILQDVSQRRRGETKRHSVLDRPAVAGRP